MVSVVEINLLFELLLIFIILLIQTNLNTFLNLRDFVNLSLQLISLKVNPNLATFAVIKQYS